MGRGRGRWIDAAGLLTDTTPSPSKEPERDETPFRAAIWVPCRDQAASERFYAALCGPPVERGGGFVTYRLADTALWLQGFYVQAWAENTVLYVGVDDADARFRHLDALRGRPGFEALRLEGPLDQPWGDRMTTTWDPSGVLIHLASRTRPTLPRRWRKSAT